MGTNQERNAPTVSSNFETEQTAKSIFESQIPQSWMRRPSSPDFHIDYTLEVTDSGELPGKNVGIQLKGWAKRHTKQSQTPSYRIKAKHLLYYWDKCEIPTFLVLVDVKSRIAYWRFMQEFAQTIEPMILRTQKSFLVEFNTADLIADHSRFLTAIDDARAMMKRLHPGTIAAAVQKRKNELEASDKRPPFLSP
jgi:hypothetical protein